MAASTIQDEDEVIRWFSEGRTYAWMSEEYERRYNITTAASVWADFRRRKGPSRRVVPDTEQGFCYVPRRPGIDLDLIREPYPT
jgi:hypothetical protein